MTRGGLPHSDIFGSKLVCGSPKLFAAYHVLHRLLAPRHSPYALSSLTIRNSKLTIKAFRSQRSALRIFSDGWVLMADSSTRQLLAHCVSAAAGQRRRDKCLWSEKTTVCRIFSCQRIEA